MVAFLSFSSLGAAETVPLEIAFCMNFMEDREDERRGFGVLLDIVNCDFFALPLDLWRALSTNYISMSMTISYFIIFSVSFQGGKDGDIVNCNYQVRQSIITVTLVSLNWVEIDPSSFI